MYNLQRNGITYLENSLNLLFNSQQYKVEFSKIGPHLRHCYNFFETLLNENPIKDYTQRDRTSQIAQEIESSQELAQEHFLALIEELKNTNLEYQEIVSIGDNGRFKTTTIADFNSLVSHTMHHLATVNASLETKLEGLGVAPSTPSQSLNSK